ncbi:unnamed protein product [Symbiodinium natans]|uniref:EF-hand domain-containing protein n=1 Tax=Symbiodinium natans TaxID=878477 RepID=A0A812VAZ0_9DINO|nr:unnamed protein product [Symbiodinium natans]
MAVLPVAIQQTISEVQSHYKKLHDQVLSLQSENLDLKKELQEMGVRSHSKVMESLINENHRLKAQMAQVRVIEGLNPPGCAPEEDELISIKTVSLEGPEVRSRIRKVSTQAVHDAVHIRKHMMNGEDAESEDGMLASDKIKKLKMDPFADTPLEPPPPLLARKSICGLCFPVDIRSTEKERLSKRFTNGLFFKSITMLAIAANTLYLGWAANTNVINSFRRLQNLPVEVPGVEFDIAFTAWFGLELLIKMIADRMQFFVGEERAWNWFDMALVVESFIGLFSTGSKLSFLRIFRVFRLVRVVKVVRSVKALARLRTMIFAILSSFVDLLWAFLVIVLIVFVFAIVFDNAVADYFDGLTVDWNATDTTLIEEVEALNQLFGNLPETMISLWSAVSGGNDWMNYGDLVRKAGGWFYFGLFNFYIAFCVVGMFNVVTGVFVDSAVCVRTGDEVVQGYLDDLRQTTEEIKGFFKDADADGSGTLNWDEFQSHMKNPAVKAYFSGLDIDPEEAEIIFTILDGDKSKEIKIDEFVNGTMKLKGSATKLDLMALMYDQTRQSMKFDALCEFVEDELVDIKRRLVLARQKEALREERNERNERNERGPISPERPVYAGASPPRATRVRIDTTRDLPRATAVPRRG